jgi:hypothetical protein
MMRDDRVTFRIAIGRDAHDSRHRQAGRPGQLRSSRASGYGDRGLCRDDISGPGIVVWAFPTGGGTIEFITTAS